MTNKHTTTAVAEDAQKDADRKKLARVLAQIEDEVLGRFAELDWRYDKTLRKSFAVLLTDRAVATKHLATAELIGRQAKERAKTALATGSSELQYGTMRQTLQAQLKEGRIEATQLTKLTKAMIELRGLEVMNQTERGKSALMFAETAAARIDEQFAAENEELAEIVKKFDVYADGKADTDLAHVNVASEYYETKAKTEYRQEIRQDMLAGIETRCLDAFEYEIYKALVKLRPDEKSQKLHNDLKRLNRVKSNVVDTSDVASDGIGWVSGSASMAMSMLTVIAETGIDHIEAAILTADWDRQVKAELKKAAADKEKARSEVAAELNQNPTAVAKLLADKYVRLVEGNLGKAEPVIRASILAAGVGLDQVGAGAGTKVLDVAWDCMKTVVLRVAKEFQKERLRLAEEKLAKVRKKELVREIDNQWKDWAGGVGHQIEKQFKEAALSSALNLPETVLNAIRDTTIKMIVRDIMRNLSVPPAQTFDGNDFMKHTRSLTNTRARAEHKVEGRDRRQAAGV